MPLCHWPCTCYPNHATGQTGDWMAEIYERWVAAHGVIIVTPVYWYQAPSVLKLMMDRLVCADGGNPDPTSTSGKDAAKAKKLELDGWPYPKHLAGRVYGVFVHGDVAGIEGLRRSLCDWLDWMGLIDAGNVARLDRYIGYYEPYASSHRISGRGRSGAGRGAQRRACRRRGGRTVPRGKALQPRPQAQVAATEVGRSGPGDPDHPRTTPDCLVAEAAAVRTAYGPQRDFSADGKSACKLSSGLISLAALGRVVRPEAALLLEAW